MADRPILFSGPMIRALLEGRKTQTRRVLKPQPSGISKAERFGAKSWDLFPESNRCTVDFKAPAYAPGDRLWVREAWADDAEAQFEPQRRGTYYRADPDAAEIAEDNRSCGIPHDWRPSIHMHRWRSRLTLIVTDVRVQRLQEISEGDAISEGCRPFFDHENPSEHIGPNGTVHQMAPLRGPVDDFHRLWDSLNAERGYGWDANPWVCAVTFTVHRQNIDQMEAA